MTMTLSRRVAGVVLVCILTGTAARGAGAQQPAAAQGNAAEQTATIRGVVLDRADGSPIADVSVRLQEAKQTVKTDDEGRFELTGVAPGRRTLYVSVVGFILVKRPVEIAPGATLELTIALSEGTGTYSENVTVSGERFREQEKSVPAQQTLGSAEIQNLRNLLTNDPMRAIQVLPGVTTGDDFHSEFAVRGSPFGRMNFTFDGVQTSFLLHTVPLVQDGGSIAMVNGDILDGITLLNGSYPQRYGNRLGAQLDFHMREGSRDRSQIRVGVSGTDASIVAEGPLGRAKAGSWLVSARKSYLELLLKQINEDDDDFGFGFSDVQSKLVYDVSSAHRLELSLVAGRSRLDQEPSPTKRTSSATAATRPRSSTRAGASRRRRRSSSRIAWLWRSRSSRTPTARGSSSEAVRDATSRGGPTSTRPVRRRSPSKAERRFSGSTGISSSGSWARAACRWS